MAVQEKKKGTKGKAKQQLSKDDDNNNNKRQQKWYLLSLLSSVEPFPFGLWKRITLSIILHYYK